MVCVAANTDPNKLSEAIQHFRKRILGKTQREMATALGVPFERYKNWEYGHEPPLDIMQKLKLMGLGGEVSDPRVPAGQLLVPIPFIGNIAASSPVDWSDPFEAVEMEFVPPEMAEGRGRFAARVVGDSMYDLLVPGDVVVFQREDIPKIGYVVMFRSFDNQITIKTLKHDGTSYLLRPENEAYATVEAKGSMVGYLVGVVTRKGSRIATVYDPYGIMP